MGGKEGEVVRDWPPFRLCLPGERPPKTRALGTAEGVGDRLRAAAFAELQAREAFRWAGGRFPDAPLSLLKSWEALVSAEDRHLGWLIQRMGELGVDAAERPVSDRLWRSLTACADARAFALFIAEAEERGRLAGERFRRALAGDDPTTAAIFGRIADEEIGHVALARGHFPEPSSS